jgi:hypothetical protein
MNITKKQIHDFLIPQLYGNNLVLINKKESIITQEKKEFVIEEKNKNYQEPTAIKYLGNHHKKIALVVQSTEALHVSDTGLEFITAILNACKLSVNDVAIINIHQQNITYQNLVTALQSQYILCFGVTAHQIQLPFTIPHYQIQAYNNTQLLFAVAIEDMLNNTKEAKLEKSKLWVCLQKMFLLK